jgi:hypothetical protein
MVDSIVVRLSLREIAVGCINMACTLLAQPVSDTLVLDQQQQWWTWFDVSEERILGKFKFSMFVN